MKYLQRTGVCIFLGLCYAIAMPETETPHMSYNALLESYTASNTKLQALAVKEQQAQIEKQKTGIENGVSFSVSSGQVSWKLDDDDMSLSATPSATVEIPVLNNTAITAKAPFTVTQSDRPVQIANNGIAAGISTKTDIISNASDTRRIALLNADRAVVESENNTYAGHLSVKKEFAQQLVTLLQCVSDILTKRDDLFEYERDFLQVRVQGYAPSSAKYRLARLKADTAQRSTEEALRVFNRTYQIFMEKCGKTAVTAKSVEDLFALLPADIPDEVPVFFDDFPLSSYIELESAEWTHYLQSLVRDADIPFSLAGLAGWEYINNESKISETASSEKEYHSVTAGLETTYKGFTAAAGVSVPITGNASPALTFSFGWDPSASKVKDLGTASGNLDAALEILDIRQAEETIRTTKINCDQTRNDLLWSKDQYAEEYAVAETLYHDSEAGFQSGIVSETDYRQAVNDYYLAHIKELTARLDRIIYNIDTAALFSAGAGDSLNEKEN